jgi:hypothetical protein
MAAARQDPAQLLRLISVNGNAVTVKSPGQEAGITLPPDLNRGDDSANISACDVDANENVEIGP